MSPPRRPGDDRRAGRRPDAGSSGGPTAGKAPRGDKPSGGKPREGDPARAKPVTRAKGSPSPVRPPHRNAAPDGGSGGGEKKKPNRASVRSFHRNAARGDQPAVEAAPAAKGRATGKARPDPDTPRSKRPPREAAAPTERTGSAARQRRTEGFSTRHDAERQTEGERQPGRSGRQGVERPGRDMSARLLRTGGPARTDSGERQARPPRDGGETRPARPVRAGFGAAPASDRPVRRAPAARADEAPRPATGDRKRPDRATPTAGARVRRDGSIATGRGAARSARSESISGVKQAPQRIAKLLARAGVASRREIERMIAEGQIELDGVVLDTPATIVSSLRGITVNGEPVEAPSDTRLFLFNKPTGFLTAERDPKGRPTIYDRLPPGLPRVMPIGRLDLNTEGLLLLTTDGEFKRKLELPATGIPRVYRARAYGEVTQQQLEALIEGVEIDGMRYGQIDANMERRTGRNVWIEVRITEGKNREVRRVLEYLGLQVSRLIRTAYGPFVLADLEPGGVVEVRQHDLVAFRQTLK